MNRETAKILSQLTDEQLGQISAEYKDYAEVIRAFADGAEVEYRNSEDKSWSRTDHLDFESMDYLRVVPDDNPDKKWRPKEDGETFFYVDFLDALSEDCFTFGVHVEKFCDDEWEHELFKRNNCFKTKEEAEVAAKKLNEAMEAILSGKSIDENSDSSAVESVDGEALTDGEKDLIRSIRKLSTIASVRDSKTTITVVYSDDIGMGISDDDISFRADGLNEHKEDVRDSLKKISNEKLLKSPKI